MKKSKRSPDSAQRNPGSRMQPTVPESDDKHEKEQERLDGRKRRRFSLAAD
jgi:hypothetical protein